METADGSGDTPERAVNLCPAAISDSSTTQRSTLDFLTKHWEHSVAGNWQRPCCWVNQRCFIARQAQLQSIQSETPQFPYTQTQKQALFLDSSKMSRSTDRPGQPYWWGQLIQFLLCLGKWHFQTFYLLFCIGQLTFRVFEAAFDIYNFSTILTAGSDRN